MNKPKKIKVFLLVIILLTAIVFSFFIIFPKVTLFTIKNIEDNPFNLKTEIPETYESVNSGKTLLFTSKVLNLANNQRIDVTLKFDVLDSNKNLIATKSETVAIETQASFVREIKIPENTLPGKYTLHTELIYQDKKEAEADNSFSIINPNNKKTNYWLIFIVGAIILMMIYISLKSKKIIDRIQIKSKIHKIVLNKVKDINLKKT
jgi:hypothetical protein